MPRLRATHALLPTPSHAHARSAAASAPASPFMQADRAALRTLGRQARLFAAAALAATLIACGGGGDSAPAPTPTPSPPPANQPPVASFISAATAQAGAPLGFDASASTDPDNDALTFSWDFGDGTRGGGAGLAHVFTAAGSYTVRLTVADSRGANTSTQRTLTVSAGPAAGAPATLRTVVSDGTSPLQGVTVSINGAGSSATTAADGKADVSVPTGVPAQLKFSKAGYADQFKQVELATGATGASMEVRMLAREAALTLPDAAAGGTLAGRDGARIVLPANALVDASGQPVTGAVQISMTPVNVGTNPGAFPGSFIGLQASGARGLLASYGTVEYVLSQNGAPVQLAPGASATIEMPIYTRLNLDGSSVTTGASIPLWSLDERTAQWVQEGSGTVVASAGSPSELALRAQVGHFSWWNVDAFVGAPFNSPTRCCIRDLPNGPCKENSGDICTLTGTALGGQSAGASAIVRPLAIDPATQRIPLSVATAQVLALGGGVLGMPPNMDVELVGTARNGSYRGVTTVRGPSGAGPQLVLDLLPNSNSGNDDPISLPWDQNYTMQGVGEVDRFLLTVAAGPGFEARITSLGGSFAGTARLRRPDNSVAAELPFGAGTPAMITEQTAVAGVYTIEVVAGGGVPGAYRLEASALSDCGSTQALTLPSTQTVTLSASQSRCYDLTLAADQVLDARVSSFSGGISGSLTLSTAGGAQSLRAIAWPAQAGGSNRIQTGIGVAGTYRLRLLNTSASSGSLQLALTQPSVQTLAVPDTLTASDITTAAGKLLLIKPPADGTYFLSLANTAGVVGAGFEPNAAGFTIGTQPSARVHRVEAPLLPVVTVFRNSGSGTVTISTGVPTPLTRDIDISATAPAGSPLVYVFSGSVGETIAFGRAHPDGSFAVTSMDVFAPSGAALGETSIVHTLPAAGLYTLQLAALGASPSPVTFRVNTAPAPANLALVPPVTSQSIDLPLGQVLRYTLDVTRGQLVGLQLNTTGALNVSASLPGVVAVETPTSGSGPFTAASVPSFVYTTGNATVTLRSTSTVLERARGTATLGVVRPVPANAALDAAVTGNVAVGEWTSYRFTVSATGRYLLRLTTSAAGQYGLESTVWAATTPFTSGYAGEFSSSLSSVSVPIEGLGQFTAGDITVTVRNTSAGTSTVPFTLALVSLDAPVPLTLGAAPTAGTIDIDGERDFFSFAGTGGQDYTVRVTPNFAGMLRVRKLNPNGDFTNRASEIFTIAGTPLTMTAGAMTTFNFTIPADATFGNGTYLVEVEAAAGNTGGYTVQLTSP
jgi:PKD repeat protein